MPPTARRSARSGRRRRDLIGRLPPPRSGSDARAPRRASILEVARQVAGAVPARPRRHDLRRADRQAHALRPARGTGGGRAPSCCRGSCRPPTRSRRRRVCAQGQKTGLEIDQGLFVSAVLRSEQSGPPPVPRHAVAAPGIAGELLPKFIKDGHGAISRRVDRAARQGRDPHLSTIRASSTPRTRPRWPAWKPASISRCSIRQVEIAVLRGGAVEHPKYKDRRVFGSGINLTHLYHGRIPFLWYLTRDLGYVNKLYRGLALPDGAAARRVRRPDHREAVRSPRSRPSRSAATARCCWRWTTCSPRRPRS